MADLVRHGNPDRDVEQALIALKKGAQLLKYGRKGKPRVYPFRLSNDETSLIWISSSGQRSLKLASISRVISGQRTAVFQRYLCPEKDYLSFSLIYNDGKRSLDLVGVDTCFLLICKDKVEAEIWIRGLKVLISSGQSGRSKIDGWNDGGLYFDDNRDLTSNSPTNSSLSATRSSPEVSITSNIISSPKSYCPDNSVHLERSHVALDQTNMQVKVYGSDAFRVSVSSGPSTSSHGSATDDCDALGDVYIWGEVICDNIVKVGPEKNSSSISRKADVLLPRILGCNAVLDVHHIACGVGHAVLVTKQGEVFSWGEESGGRLGHGVGKDVGQPRLLESLSYCNVDFVACGEFHSCAVTVAGELYTWGDGTHNAGLLGHGTDLCHWIPKKISGPLEALQVAIVSCGPWHTALVASTGQLFTFGDGTFGALGHGNRDSLLYPREIESLSGLRTIAVACGVWHTAAVVEVITTQSSASVSSAKLFTWGDGDKNRLGHGDKEPRLKPTCVPALIDYSFQKVACGHSLTVGLTASGSVFTMGSTVYGQLGNPQSDGKAPCLVEESIGIESVREISCGAYHVAVLTSKNEIYTWGKGANGRLGHGDIEDRKTPTLLESLKDRHVKYIACGANYSAAICLHKWVSNAEQSQCLACRLAFGFTRKRHNCYNCGLVHCHACSSRKALRAALAPNPSKPYRVCDSCFTKLNKVAKAGANSRINAVPRLSSEYKDKLDKVDPRLVNSATPSNFDLIKQLDSKAAKQGKRADAFYVGHSSQLSAWQLTDIIDEPQTFSKPILTPSSVISSRTVSPFSRKHTPPRSATPVPTASGLSFSKSSIDSLKKTNELLNQEVRKLRLQVESLRNQYELQDLELQISTKKAQDAMTLAAEESSRCKAAKEVIKSLAAQLKDMAERLPPGAYDPESLKLVCISNGLEPNGLHNPGAMRLSDLPENVVGSNESISTAHRTGLPISDDPNDIPVARLLNGNASVPSFRSSISKGTDTKDPRRDSENGGLKATNAAVPGNSNHTEGEWIEQYEPGVYITLLALQDGSRDLKRVRFSRRRFGEHQAEAWWLENREKVYEKHNVRGSDKSSVSGHAARRSDGALSPSSQF